jgi:hypothetical protein
MAILGTLAVVYATVRLGFFTAMTGLETRYLVEMAPFLEAFAGAAAVMLAMMAWRRTFGAVRPG